MTLISDLVNTHGHGLLHKRQLVRLGARDRHLTAAVRSGDVRRARRGWYTTFDPSDPRFIAVRVGGRLTGAAALDILGAWNSGTPRISVSVPQNAARLRRKPGVRVVWDDEQVCRRGSSWAVDPLDALGEALLEVPFEEAVALLDWALHEKLLSLDDLPGAVAHLPSDARGIVDWVDPDCESIGESIVRTRLRAAGYAVSSQEPVNGSQRIDLVVNDVVGIEVDGRTFHESSFESDRRKDLAVVREGRTPLRVSYRMVREMWGQFLVAVETAVRMHRRGAVVCVGKSGPCVPVACGGGRAWRIPRRSRSARPELPRGRTRRTPLGRRTRGDGPRYLGTIVG
jgi:very-short-patch-repair endonuclease